MENASKALLMAGATLIAILLISLFMWFLNVLRDYNSASASLAKSTEIEAFNRFFIYSRPNNGMVTGVDMINIAGKARDYNTVYQDIDYTITVNATGSFFTDSALVGVIEGGNFDTITDEEWNSFIDSVRDSSDSALGIANIHYEYQYNNEGRINEVRFF